MMKFTLIFVFALGLALSLCDSAVAAGDKEAFVNCVNGTFDSGEIDPDVNELEVGKKITWLVLGKRNTTVEIIFQTKEGLDCEGTEPFDPGTIKKGKINKSYEIVKLDSKPVKTGADGTEGKCYNYKIICKLVGKTVTIDPIIDVPKP